MASYEMQELNLPGQEGGRVLFPRMKLCGQMDLDEITRRICSGSTFTPGDVKGLVMALSREIADGMAEGRSVKVDGIGVFTPGLGLRKGFERETGREGERRRNARSICVDRIHFRADKELLRETDRNCYLERSDWKFRKSSTRYTPEERLGLAREFSHRFGLCRADRPAPQRRSQGIEALGGGRDVGHRSFGARDAQGVCQEGRACGIIFMSSYRQIE